MFDTIKLSIPYEKVVITKESKDAFRISPDAFLSIGDKNYRIISKEEIKQGAYLRHIDVIYTKGTNKQCEKQLYIEFSCPKLLFGNNYYECDEDLDFQTLLDTLVSKLKLLGIFVDKQTLSEAKIERLDIGKNIILDNISKTPSFVKTIISLFSKIPVHGSHDTDHKDFHNGGSAYYNTWTDHTFTVYDKIYDLQKNGLFLTKSEQNQEKTPSALLAQLKANNITNVIRLEFRLKKHSTIQRTLYKACKTNIPCTLKGIFKKNVAKLLNLYAYEQYIEPYIKCICTMRYRSKHYIDTVINTPGINLSQITTLLAIKYVSEKADGLYSFRSLKKSYPNFFSHARTLINKHLILNPTPISKVFKQIKKELESNIPIRRINIYKYLINKQINNLYKETT